MRLFLLALALLPVTALAQVRLPLVFSEGAVLQRDHEIPIWGWADAHDIVAVTLAGERRSATADASGLWRVALPAMPVGGPHTLTVEASGETRTVADVMLGDVWLLSGQSNMEWTVRDVNDAETEIAGATDSRIRHFKVPQSFADAPEAELAGGRWEVASPQTVGAFSGVGYFFARDVRAHHDVPIGLLHASWGGSRIEPWMSAEMLGYTQADRDARAEAQRERTQSILRDLRATIGALPDSDRGMDGDRALWAAPEADDSGWDRIRVPSQWEAQGYAGLDGVAWYRTTFALTPDEAASGVTLGVGMIDDEDITWVNGMEVGRMTNGWNQARAYAVPPEALRAGDNVIAVRVVDHRLGGGIAGAEDLVYVQTASGERRPLVGDWRFAVGAVQIGEVSTKNQEPTVLWNKMVHPLTPLPIVGVLWYQGESNAGEGDAAAYGALFRAMISGWREAWDRPDLPFYWVQLTSFMDPPEGPEDIGTWPTLRESQSSALALGATAEAVILDVGEADDIHPRHKQTVGHRLALAARKNVYGEADLVASGPRYRGHEIQGDRVMIAFDHARGGLATRDGAPLGGFALQEASGAWHWAEARIDGDRVIVSHPSVPSPVAVRYAWANNPTAATLTNAEGLPAAPFHTRD